MRWQAELARAVHRVRGLLIAPAVFALGALALSGGAAAGTTEPITFSSTGGLQTFTVPSGVTDLRIAAVGAEGAGGGNSAYAGDGAAVQGDFTVASGDVLTILVGGQPSGRAAGGGGGGSSVWTGTGAATASNLLLAAGGGGGDSSCGQDGQNAGVGPTGTASALGVLGGSAGAGGSGGSASIDDPIVNPSNPFNTGSLGGGGGGAGLLTSGGDGQAGSIGDNYGAPGGGGEAIRLGGQGGANVLLDEPGGFGGGGGAAWGNGGGGGGYSGGGGGGVSFTTCDGGGGGGSFNAGANQNNIPGGDRNNTGVVGLGQGAIVGLGGGEVVISYPQAITTSYSYNQTYGTSINLATTATGGGSGNPLTFAIDPSSQAFVCSLSGTILSFVGLGGCEIDVNQAGSGPYDPAPQAYETFNVNPALDTITFTSGYPNEPWYGSSYVPAATASDGGYVLFSIEPSSSGVCYLAGDGSVYFDGIGYCDIEATQPSTYSADYVTNPAYKDIYVGQAPQSITLGLPKAVTYLGVYNFSIGGNDPSGNQDTISLNASSDSCVLSGQELSITNLGYCEVDAYLPGNADYLPATAEVSYSYPNIAPASQTIEFGSTPPNQPTVGGSYLLSATSIVDEGIVSSGGGVAQNPITFSVDDSSGAGACSISGPTVLFTGVGPCVIDANQAAEYGSDPGGDSVEVYAVAPQVQQSFTILPPPCRTLSGALHGPLVVAAGQAVCLAPGADQSGPVTVKAGGSLHVDAATVNGPVTSTGAASIRICGSTVDGPVSVTASTGLVTVGDADGGCAGNALRGPVKVDDNADGARVSNNHISGPLEVLGNNGSLPPPDSGAIDVGDNTVTGPQHVQ